MRRSEKVGHPLLGAEYLGHNKRNSKVMNHLDTKGIKQDGKGHKHGDLRLQGGDFTTSTEVK